MADTDSGEETRKRFDMVLAAKYGHTEPTPEIRQRNIFVMMPGFLWLMNDRHLKSMESIISKVQPALVVIDSLYACSDSEDHFRSVVPILKKHMKAWCIDHKTSIVIVHHAKKGAGSDAEGIHGSQFLNSCNDGSIQMRMYPDPNTDPRSPDMYLGISRIFRSFESDDEDGHQELHLYPMDRHDQYNYISKVTPKREKNDSDTSPGEDDGTHRWENE
jgi:hypothetical protein